MQSNQARLMAAVRREMLAASRNSLDLTLTWQEAFAALGSLQLALRHPEMPDRAAVLTKLVAVRIEKALEKFGTATAELCRRGWETERPQH